MPIHHIFEGKSVAVRKNQGPVETGPSVHIFTCGEYDEAPHATMAYYRSRVPGSDLVVFEGASHSHHLEETEAYLAAVREFLRCATFRKERS